MSIDPHVVIDRILAADGLLSGYIYTHLSVREDLKDLFESAVKCSGTKEPGYLFQGTYSYNRTQAADVLMHLVPHRYLLESEVPEGLARIIPVPLTEV